MSKLIKIRALTTILTVATAVNAQLLPTPKVIVQIGDSYASGNGAGNYVGVDGCFRSSTTWGAQFAQSINAVSTFINRGCSGGRFIDVSNARLLGSVVKDGQCPIPPSGSDEFYTDNGPSSCSRSIKSQLSSLNSTVDLVLFAMGGNDMQFENLVKKCLIGGLRDARACQAQIDFVRNNAAAWTLQLSNALTAMNPLLKPSARVIVLQFPHIVLDTPFTFTEIFGGRRIEITNNLRSLGSVLDDGQRSAIATANTAANRTFVLYYDQVKALFEGHEPHPSAFSNNLNGWINEGSAPLDAEIYHLNEIGHSELGKALQQYVAPLVTIVSPVLPPVFPPAQPLTQLPSTRPITPPISPPVTPPVAPPISPPVTPPVTRPVTPPISPPVTPPISPPVTPPISPPVTPPISPPVTPPISPPVTPPISPPVTPPISPPVMPPTASSPLAPLFRFLSGIFRFLFGWLL